MRVCARIPVNDGGCVRFGGERGCEGLCVVSEQVLWRRMGELVSPRCALKGMLGGLQLILERGFVLVCLVWRLQFFLC